MPVSTGKIYLGTALIAGGGSSDTGQVWSQAYYDAIYAAGPGSWSRPEWRTLPTVGTSDQKFVGLHAVFPSDGNFCALTCSGNYTVDWGDGLTENFNAGVRADHLYDYADADLAGTDAPVTIASSIITRTAHGFTNGKVVTFWNISGVTGISNGQTYFVINADANTFQVSATSGGSALTLTGSGSASLTRYKQAIVTVTPQGGQNLTALTLNVKHGQAGTQLYNTGWLDVMVGSPNFSTTGLVIAQNSSTETVRKHSIERVRVVNFGATNVLISRFQNLRSLMIIELSSTAAVTNISSMFANCTNLLTVPLFNTATVTDMSNMFGSCTSLQTVPLFNTAVVTTMGSMFSSCSRLQTVPLFNTAAVTNMTTMFNTCTSLQTVPLFNTVAATNMGSMFTSCSSLQAVPLFNTAVVTNMSGMFTSCTSLQTVPLFNTTALTNMSSMFTNCSTLKTVPLFSPTAALTNMSSMFGSCTSLQTVPLFNTAAVTDMSSMFTSCSSLKTVPLFNTAAATNMSGMFSSCTSLQTVPLFNTAAVTNMSSMFSSCTTLRTVPLFNTAVVTTMGSMFSSCTSLQTVPLFNTAAVTTMGSMFSSCQTLQTVPLFNTATVTAMGSMFFLCYALQGVPILNVTAVTSSSNFSSMFTLCENLSRIEAKDFRFTFSVSNCKLSATALNEIYTNLPTVTAQTITVSGNYGTTGDDPTIATAKGWTVTG